MRCLDAAALRARASPTRCGAAWPVGRPAGVATVDFALGALTYLADMTPEAGEAVFAIARTVGWIAHALEEYSEEPLRFRFRARYTGD